MASGGVGEVEGEEMEIEMELGKSMTRRELHQSPPDLIHLQRLRREKVVAMTTEANQSIAEFSYLRRRRKLLSQMQSKIDVSSESVTETGIFPAPEFNSITAEIMVLCRKMEQIEGEAEGRSTESGKPMKLHKFDYVSSNIVQKMEENAKKAVKRRNDLKGKSATEPEVLSIYYAFSSTNEDLDVLCAHLEEMQSFYRGNKQVTNASKSESIAEQINQVQGKVSNFQLEVLQVLILELEAEIGLSCELLGGQSATGETKEEQHMNGGKAAKETVAQTESIDEQIARKEQHMSGGKAAKEAVAQTESIHEHIAKEEQHMNGGKAANETVAQTESIDEQIAQEEQHMNGGKTAKETVAQTESIDEQIAASYRRGWEDSWGSKFGRCGAFEDMSE